MTRNTLKIALSGIALALMASGSLAADEPIYGSQLMTRQERMEHRTKMNAAKSVQERDQVRLEHHEQMKLRAKERGVSLPDAPPGLKGISLFLVPKFLVNDDGSLGARNDLICASIEHKLGIHGSPTAVMSYGEKEGAIGYLIGEENKGVGYMFTMMNHARVNVGLEGVGIAERAYQHALWYARERVQGAIIGDKSGVKKPILHHPDVRRLLMDCKARTEAMRRAKGSVQSGAKISMATPGWRSAKRA